MKSRLQAGRASALKYKSSIDGILTILKDEGIEGLYKGIGSKLVQSVLTAAILFAGQRRIYEITKNVSFVTPIPRTYFDFIMPGPGPCFVEVDYGANVPMMYHHSYRSRV